MITAWPGLGRLMLDALRARDVYLVAGCAAPASVFLAVGTLLSDAALALRRSAERRERRLERCVTSTIGLALLVRRDRRGRRGAGRWRRTPPDEHFRGLLNAPPTRAARRRRCAARGTRRSSIRWTLVEPARAALRTGSIARACRSRGSPAAASGRIVGRRARAAAARSAPTATAAMCSAGCCSARASRSGLSLAAAARRDADRRAARRRRRLRRRARRRSADARVGLRAWCCRRCTSRWRCERCCRSCCRRATCSCCSPASSPSSARRSSRAACAPSCAPSGSSTTPSAAVSLGASHARAAAAAPAAGGARLHRRPDHAAGARVHRRRSDAVVRRPRVSGSGGELGHDAARRVERPRVRRFSVAAQSGGGDVPRGARSEPRAAAISRHRAGATMSSR